MSGLNWIGLGLLWVGLCHQTVACANLVGLGLVWLACPPAGVGPGLGRRSLAPWLLWPQAWRPNRLPGRRAFLAGEAVLGPHPLLWKPRKCFWAVHGRRHGLQQSSWAGPCEAPRSLRPGLGWPGSGEAGAPHRWKVVPTPAVPRSVSPEAGDRRHLASPLLVWTC